MTESRSFIRAFFRRRKINRDSASRCVATKLHVIAGRKKDEIEWRFPLLVGSEHALGDRHAGQRAVEGSGP
jgi:hypothetical protein